jgi:hypothetical protein
MTSSLKFDPLDYDYGAPTEAIRSILAEWIEIDWFEPNPAGEDHGVHMFREHQRLAHAQLPGLFPRHVDVRVVSGDGEAFVGWCNRIVSPSWDWKSLLKKLGIEHARARGWSPELQVERTPSRQPPGPGDMFFVLDDKTGGRRHVVWTSLVSTPDLLRSLEDAAFGNAAHFYADWAKNDAVECMKWQLAENSADLSTNPFLPLLLCYEAGAYPFSLSKDSVVLFNFEGHPTASN